MKRLTTVVIALACGVGAVWADTDPIAQRRALMKNDGMAAKKLFDMSKGAAPFDLATVQALLKTLAEGATKTPALFPDNSVHSSQVVADFEVVMESHDSALHFIATELELIATQTPYPQPEGVDWEKVRPDQFADIPFLGALRQTIERSKRTRRASSTADRYD